MIAHEHALHQRRWTRNLGLGLLLAAFVLLVFGLTVVKVSRQDEGAVPQAAETQGAATAIAPAQGTAP